MKKRNRESGRGAFFLWKISAPYVQESSVLQTPRTPPLPPLPRTTLYFSRPINPPLKSVRTFGSLPYVRYFTESHCLHIPTFLPIPPFSPQPSETPLMARRKRTEQTTEISARTDGSRTSSTNDGSSSTNDADAQAFDATSSTNPLEECERASDACFDALVAMRESVRGTRAELEQRKKELEERKLGMAQQHGGTAVTPRDKLKLNVGGVQITTLRETLTQFPDTRLAALFSGRWENCLVRDKNNRIFLDVNPKCFQKILSYHQLCKIAAPESLPDLPTMPDDMQHIMEKQLEFFGLAGGGTLPFVKKRAKNARKGNKMTKKLSGSKRAHTGVETNDDIDSHLSSWRAAIIAERNAYAAALETQSTLEQQLDDEEAFIKYFSSGETADVVDLDVSGKCMTVKRSTLMACEGSMLASKFSTQWKQDDDGGVQRDHAQTTRRKWEGAEGMGGGSTSPPPRHGRSGSFRSDRAMMLYFSNLPIQRHTAKRLGFVFVVLGFQNDEDTWKILTDVQIQQGPVVCKGPMPRRQEEMVVLVLASSPKWRIRASRGGVDPEQA